MKEYEIEIDDSTASLLDAIAEAEDDPLAIAALAGVSAEEFRQFMTECGEDSSEAIQLLKAAESLEQSKLYQPTVHKSRFAPELIYLLIGGGIGAILALLFAPKSGKELRSDIAGVTRSRLNTSEEKLVDKVNALALEAEARTMTADWDVSGTGAKVHEKEKRRTEASGGLGVVPKLDERSSGDF